MNGNDPSITHAPEIAQLFDIATRLLAEHNRYEESLNGVAPGDPQDAANRMLGLRGAEFALAAVDDFHFNRPAAGAVIGRALLETALVLRWCLQSEKNAQRWWREGDSAIQKSTRSLGVSSDPAVVALRKAKSIGVGRPSLPAMAKAAGLVLPYDRWYPTLSPYAHGSRMSMVHAYGPAGKPSPPPLVMPCIYFANDIGTVFTSWSTKREVPTPWPHP